MKNKINNSRLCINYKHPTQLQLVRLIDELTVPTIFIIIISDIYSYQNISQRLNNADIHPHKTFSYAALGAFTNHFENFLLPHIQKTKSLRKHLTPRISHLSKINPPFGHRFFPPTNSIKCFLSTYPSPSPRARQNS